MPKKKDKKAKKPKKTGGLDGYDIIGAIILFGFSIAVVYMALHIKASAMKQQNAQTNQGDSRAVPPVYTSHSASSANLSSDGNPQNATINETPSSNPQNNKQSSSVQSSNVQSSKAQSNNNSGSNSNDKNNSLNKADVKVNTAQKNNTDTNKVNNQANQTKSNQSNTSNSITNTKPTGNGNTQFNSGSSVSNNSNHTNAASKIPLNGGNKDNAAARIAAEATNKIHTVNTGTPFEVIHKKLNPQDTPSSIGKQALPPAHLEKIVSVDLPASKATITGMPNASYIPPVASSQATIQRNTQQKQVIGSQKTTLTQTTIIKDASSSSPVVKSRMNNGNTPVVTSTQQVIYATPNSEVTYSTNNQAVVSNEIQDITAQIDKGAVNNHPDTTIFACTTQANNRIELQIHQENSANRLAFYFQQSGSELKLQAKQPANQVYYINNKKSYHLVMYDAKHWYSFTEYKQSGNLHMHILSRKKLKYISNHECGTTSDKLGLLNQLVPEKYAFKSASVKVRQVLARTIIH